MTARPLRFLVAVLLTVTLTAMGFAAASARGQTVVRGQVMVLCSGGGLVQVTLDAEGRPTGDSQLCPDLAAYVIAAHALAPVAILRPTSLAARIAPAAPARTAGIGAGTPRARDPPVSV